MPLYDQSDIEGRLCLAINALKSSQIQSICTAARVYSIPFESLCTRYHGTLSQRDTRPTICKLISTKEEALLQYILDLDIQ